MTKETSPCHIVFYGDSNTYGYDPRDFSGGRYPDGSIWTDLIRDMLGDEWEVVNEGMNGRRIPGGPGGYRYIAHYFERLSPEDIFAVMLGTNDILMSVDPDADGAIRRMKALLAWMTSEEGHPRILLIAPPYIGTKKTADPLMIKYYNESVRMNEGFSLLAREAGVMFADSSEWNIETAYDGVHFSEAGHGTFAGNLFLFIKEAL